MWGGVGVGMCIYIYVCVCVYERRVNGEMVCRHTCACMGVCVNRTSRGGRMSRAPAPWNLKVADLDLTVF